nr:angiopoietin-4-like isoform X8 [Syngnathus scovelli]
MHSSREKTQYFASLVSSADSFADFEPNRSDGASDHAVRVFPLSCASVSCLVPTTSDSLTSKLSERSGTTDDGGSGGASLPVAVGRSDTLLGLQFQLPSHQRQDTTPRRRWFVQIRWGSILAVVLLVVLVIQNSVFFHLNRPQDIVKELRALVATLPNSILDHNRTDLARHWAALQTALAELKAELKAELEAGQTALAELKAGQTAWGELKAGQEAGQTTLAELKAGQDAGQEALAELKAELKEGQTAFAELKAGQTALAELKAGLEAGQTTLAQLKAGQEALAQLKAGQEAGQTTLAQLKAGQEAGQEALAELKAGQTALAQLKAGQEAGQTTLAQLKAGQDAGQEALAELKAELKEGQTALAELKAGQTALAELKAGQEAGQEALAELKAELKEGQTALAQLKAGQTALAQLKAGLEAGQTTLAQLKAGQEAGQEALAELKAGQTALAQLKAGQEAGQTTLAQLKAGQEAGQEALAELKAGQTALAQLKAGQEAGQTTLAQLKAGQEAGQTTLAQLKAGQEAGQTTLAQLKVGQEAGQEALAELKAELKEGQTALAELKAGQTALAELKAELKAGQTALAELKAGQEAGQTALRSNKGLLNQILKDLETDYKSMSQELSQENKELHNISLALSSLRQKLVDQPTLHRELHGLMPRDCSDIKAAGKSTGVYMLFSGSNSFKAYCNMWQDGGGWTVIQRRRNGTVNFFRGWNDYRKGFGDLAGEHWLGLQNIHALTASDGYQLRIDFTAFDGRDYYARYDYFSVGRDSLDPEKDSYPLLVSGYSGDAGDRLSQHSGMMFTTKDHDQDTWNNGNCANNWNGAWWYEKCYWSNLNGLYKATGTCNGANAVWLNLGGPKHTCLKFVEMKIRPRK